MAIELGVGYLSILPETSKIAPGIRQALGGTEDEAERSGKRAGKRYAARFRSGIEGLSGPALAVGAGIAGLVASSVNLEKQFSQTMSVAAATTGAPQKEMQKLSRLALQLGADTSFSANEAADATLELAKGGLSAATIQAGALEGTLQLAAAGGTSLASAAEIASNALNTFKIPGKNMAKVSAALAGGANASTASVESLGQALSQVGPGAVNAGLDLNDTIGALAAFDNAGIKGSDAGTSLKTMLARLVPQTKKARDAMKDANLDFVDADGNFVSLSNVAQQLKTNLGGLSEAQRTTALNTIFGSDASRAASVLMTEGAEGLNKYIKATKDQGAAESAAKARMSGTAGALERLSGSWETFRLRLGIAVAPVVELVADKLGNLFDMLGRNEDTVVKVGIGVGVFAAVVLALNGVLIAGRVVMSAWSVATATGSAVMAAATAIDRLAIGTRLGLLALWVRETAAMVANTIVRKGVVAASGLYLAVSRLEIGTRVAMIGLWVRETAAMAANRAGVLAQTVSRKAASWALFLGMQTRAILGWVRETAAIVANRVALAAVAAARGIAGLASFIAMNARATLTWTLQTAAIVANRAASLGLVAVQGIVRGALLVAAGAQWALNAAMTANPIGLVIAGIAALVAGLVWFFTETEVGRKIWTAAWNGIKVAASAVVSWFTGTALPWMRKAWDGIADAASSSWRWLDRHVFIPFKFGIALLGAAFKALPKVIGAAMDKVRAAAAKPINFVIETVYNNGIKATWDKVADAVGLDLKLPTATPVKFATGGVLPGYTPGRDVHEFYSPTGGRLSLSGGEAIMRPEFTRAVGGPAGVAALNARARKGQAFKDGGVWGWAGDAWQGVQNTAASVGRFLSNPAGALGDLLKKPLDRVLGQVGGGSIGKIASQLPKKAVGALIDKAKSLVGGMTDLAGGGKPAGPALGWQAQWDAVKTAFPGASLNSAFRPGAITAVGTPSYHGQGRAIDVTPSMAIFNWIAKHFPNSRELIYSPANGRQIWNGRNYTFGEPTRGDHWDHVHWAMKNGGVWSGLFDQGGWLPNGGVGMNLTGKPEAVLTPAESKALKAGVISSTAEARRYAGQKSETRTADGRRVELVITNWEKGTGYFREIAEDAVESASEFAGSTGRMR